MHCASGHLQLAHSRNHKEKDLSLAILTRMTENKIYRLISEEKWIKTLQTCFTHRCNVKNITTQSVASPRTPHYSMMPIVTFTFDLWPPKLIGFILSPWLTCLPSLMNKYTTVQFLSCSQAYFHICQSFSLYHDHKLISLYVHCDLELWPVTSKINRVYSHTMANMSAKFDEEAHSSLVFIVFTSLLPVGAQRGCWHVQAF